MARLDREELNQIHKLLDNCQQKVLLCSFPTGSSKELPKALEGMVGVLDWRLHGKITKLAKLGQLKPNTVSFLPCLHRLGSASLLIFPANEAKPDSKIIIQTLKKLGLDNVGILGSTMAQDALAGLKKSLQKNKLQWEVLEEQP